MHGFAILCGDSAMYQFFAAFTARHGADAHSALITGIYCHRGSPLLLKIVLRIIEKTA